MRSLKREKNFNILFLKLEIYRRVLVTIVMKFFQVKSKY